jgi:hypothetical protein
VLLDDAVNLQLIAWQLVVAGFKPKGLQGTVIALCKAGKNAMNCFKSFLQLM